MFYLYQQGNPITKVYCKMEVSKVVNILKEAGVKPTSNRILVLRSIIECNKTLSLSDLESKLLSLEKSSIFRVLRLLLKHGIIHSIEDGRGMVRYEICTSDHECHDDDQHAHFYCEVCQDVFCFKNIYAPLITLPNGFQIHSVNYMLKGICPACKAKLKA